MSNYELGKSPSCDRNLPNYAQGSSVKIVKGSLKGCRGKITGCTNQGVYFIQKDRCDTASDEIYSPIDLFLPEEFELAE